MTEVPMQFRSNGFRCFTKAETSEDITEERLCGANKKQSNCTDCDCRFRRSMSVSINFVF